jgi:hypothetical protein
MTHVKTVYTRSSVNLMTRALAGCILGAVMLLPGQVTAAEKSSAQSIKTVQRIPLSSIRKHAANIDVIVERNLRNKGGRPNLLASDEVFMRRVYLDLAGRIPTYDEARAFLDESSPLKRSLLIDTLLDSEAYVSNFYNYWADILRMQSRLPGINGAEGGQNYIQFVKDALSENLPYNEFVYQLIAAKGALWEEGNGAVGYYYRDRGMPLDNMANTVQIFLGTQIQCAQCHDHPFDKWTQLDFYKMAAFTEGMNKNLFMDEPVKRLGLASRDYKSKGKTLDAAGERVAFAFRSALAPGIDHMGSGQIRLPDNYAYDNAKPKQLVNAATLFGPEVTLDFDQATKGEEVLRVRDKRQKNKSRLPDVGSRDAYAQWIVSKDNPRFTTVIANRLWKKVMGVGLIEPIDDINDTTTPSNPELMTYLEKLMQGSRYDLKQYLRVLCNTKTYQRQASTYDISEGKEYHFPGPTLRRMTAEQIWDSMLALTVPDIDTRPARQGASYSELYNKISNMSVEQLQNEIESIKKELPETENVQVLNREVNKAIQARYASSDPQIRKQQEANRERENLRRQMREAKEKKNWARNKELQKEMQDLMSTRQMFPLQYVRASELPSPAPAGHFVREFGASDREQIENASTAAVVTHALSMMNGLVETTLLNHRNSVIVNNIQKTANDEDKLDVVFLSILGREPDRQERTAFMRNLGDRKEDAFRDVAWVLLNSHEFMFIQ